LELARSLGADEVVDYTRRISQELAKSMKLTGLQRLGTKRGT
jgi:hypothetical protein